MRSPERVLAFLAIVAGCARSREPAPKDDIGALTGKYERTETDLAGKSRRGTLDLRADGLTYERPHLLDTITFDAIHCRAPESCEIEAIGCTLKLSRAAEGHLTVEADPRCRHVAGEWSPVGPAPAPAPAPVPVPTADSASSAEPEDDEDEAGFEAAEPERPVPGKARGSSARACLQACNDVSMTCARACTAAPAPTASAAPRASAAVSASAAPPRPAPSPNRDCLADCNQKGFACATRCTKL